jgi:hypothetical protein
MSDWGKYAQWKRVLVYTSILSVLPIPLRSSRNSFRHLRLAPITPGDNTPVVEGDVYGLVEEVSEWS